MVENVADRLLFDQCTGQMSQQLKENRIVGMSKWIVSMPDCMQVEMDCGRAGLQVAGGTYCPIHLSLIPGQSDLRPHGYACPAPLLAPPLALCAARAAK